MAEIQLPGFQGPLALLLHLIEREDLDITEVSLVQVTDQYLRIVRGADGIDAHALAEFVAIGAKLIFLKSRALLPPQPAEDETDGDEPDVGQELVDLLREYQRFGEVTDLLQERQELGLRVFPRDAPAPELPPGTGLDTVTLERLTRIMQEIMGRKRPDKPTAVVRRETLTLSQRIDDLRGRLRTRRRFSFRGLMEECESRVEVVVAFLAILELLKNGECDVQQPQVWGDFEVVAIAPATLPAAAN